MEVFQTFRFQFACTQVSLLDQEHDLCFFSLFDDTLECVWSQSSVSRTYCRQFRCSNYTICNFYRRNSVFFLSLFDLEIQEQFRFRHFWNIVERSFHCVSTTSFVSNSLVITLNFFSLEYSSLSFCFATIPSQNWSNFNSSVFLEVLFREFTCNSNRNFTTHSFQNFWVSSEVVSRQFAHLTT